MVGDWGIGDIGGGIDDAARACLIPPFLSLSRRLSGLVLYGQRCSAMLIDASARC